MGHVCQNVSDLNVPGMNEVLYLLITNNNIS